MDASEARRPGEGLLAEALGDVGEDLRLGAYREARLGAFREDLPVQLQHPASADEPGPERDEAPALALPADPGD